MTEKNETEKRGAELPCYTYLLQCADGSLYCGWTNNLEKRVAAHNAGKGAKYTKSRRPVILVYYEVFSSKQEAMKREAAIKHLSRQEKLRLIQKNSPCILERKGV
ncbi:MAG: GIY-YIG nuclease family protein [bacterium]|nr:GIY-YIG nuclease family protein [bacterium]